MSETGEMNFKLNNKDVGTILMGLQELTYKVSVNVINKMLAQTEEYQKKRQEKELAVPDKNPVPQKTEKKE